MGRSPLHFSACLSAMLSLAQASMESQGGMERCIASVSPSELEGGNAGTDTNSDLHIGYKFGSAYYWMETRARGW